MDRCRNHAIPISINHSHPQEAIAPKQTNPSDHVSPSACPVAALITTKGDRPCTLTQGIHAPVGDDVMMGCRGATIDRPPETPWKAGSHLSRRSATRSFGSNPYRVLKHPAIFDGRSATAHSTASGSVPEGSAWQTLGHSARNGPRHGGALEFLGGEGVALGDVAGR